MRHKKKKFQPKGIDELLDSICHFINVNVNSKPRIPVEDLRPVRNKHVAEILASIYYLGQKYAFKAKL